MTNPVSSGSVQAKSTHHWQPGSCARQPRMLNGFLNAIELEATECRHHADAFARLRGGELQAVIVHGVYAPEVLHAAVEKLERRDPPFLQTWFPEKFRSWFYGRNLNLSHPALDGYFDEAAQFHAQLEQLLPGALGLVPHLGALLAQLDGGRAFLPAPGPAAGKHYMFTTLRAHMEGGYIPPHFDNEQTLRPTYRHLHKVVELHMTSFVLALTQAEGGGALEVFDHVEQPAEARMLSDDRVAEKPDVARFDSVSFRLPAGSLIVLDSGRYLHRLTPVSGTRKRWTACSFMALSRNRDATYCWG
ncbi:MAG TPA: hypothetical protein VF460_05505 [Burkholderiales bacterium]